MLKNKLAKTRALLTTLLCVLSIESSAGSLVPPPYNLTDRHNVNMASGQISITHQDVKIGGELGLSHSISMHNNHWVGQENGYDTLVNYGPLDQYDGLLYVSLHKTGIGSGFYEVIASDGVGTYTFASGLSLPTSSITAVPVNGCFPPLTDLRAHLCFNGSGYLELTKQDGTKVFFDKTVTAGVLNISDRIPMNKIEKPNGLTIKKTFHTARRAASIYTNSGYQLRYYYIRDDRPMSTAGAISLSNDLDVDSSSTQWSDLTPRFIKAINRSVENCSIEPTPSNQTTWTAYDNGNECSANSWPKVEYIWPAGMPRRMYIARDTFSVVNPDGARTDYIHEPYDKAQLNGEGVWEPAPPNTYKIPRLAAVKDARANRITEAYSYKTKSTLTNPGSTWMSTWVPTNFGVLKQAGVDGDYTGYSMGEAGQYSNIFNASAGYQPITIVNIDSRTSAPIDFDAWNQSARFTGAAANQMLTLTNKMTKANVTDIQYDARNNVTSITAQGGTQTAAYALTCDYAANGNYKICNSPLWIKDANGNRTDFTYDAASGQVTSVKAPADKNGVRATTNYTYKAYQANYIGKDPSDLPIILKDTESTCSRTETCSDYASGLVKKEFFYDVNRNLNLIGVKVTAADTAGQPQSKLTCYRYDIYGNLIGESQPEANKAKASCNY